MAKIHWLVGIAAATVIGGTTVYAYTAMAPKAPKNTEQKVTKKSNQKISSSSIMSESSISDVSSYASSKAAETPSQSFEPAGEMSEAAESYSSEIVADTGVPITPEMIAEARQQLQGQGINAGSFSDGDIASVINKANSESVDYATAIKELFPAFFNN